ncbi:hypothetical protein BY996DRAFT_6424443 [Phakopsora pachyrhizi]|nr:hypothetical protein BY996DRAFT_6424443 [Phakopsora pachyrhizi]
MTLAVRFILLNCCSGMRFNLQIQLLRLSSSSLLPFLTTTSFLPSQRQPSSTLPSEGSLLGRFCREAYPSFLFFLYPEQLLLYVLRSDVDELLVTELLVPVAALL